MSVVVDRHARAMGGPAQVIVYAHSPHHADNLAGLALERIEILEDTWSRFRPDSALSRLNERAGRGPQSMGPDLALLVIAMLEASAVTQGRYDPTVLHSMTRLGYDRDFAAVIAREALEVAAAVTSPTPGTLHIDFDPTASTVTLPRGVGLDPGGIGKGLAADIVTSEIEAAGATGVLVNLGGDVVTRGTASGAPWLVGIHDDRLPSSPVIEQVTLTDALPAIATSSTLKRRWHGRHHVVSPLTGLPAETDLAQVSVQAPSGWLAEAATTCVLLLGEHAGANWLREQGFNGLLLPADTTRSSTHVAARGGRVHA